MYIILQIVVLVVLMQIIGFIWYGPLFGNLWGEIIGMPRNQTMSSEEKQAFRKRMLPVLVGNILFNILTVFAFFFFTQTTLFYPIPLAVILFLGFILPVEAGVAMWSGKPRQLAWKMFWVMIGYQFIAFLLMGVVYTLW